MKAKLCKWENIINTHIPEFPVKETTLVPVPRRFLLGTSINEDGMVPRNKRSYTGGRVPETLSEYTSHNT
ncbi:hypothetical protein DPMN_060721 [Dreissena polymorpha]|uniref:Uncharacterized protein n=1 Tax=Dreissena polymorpha TaxID=45954 RepID=A0A9D4C660_DREPO|nr:hypothetical protein DPMN_060632 [Dreissena polymorpha]KAH3717925.1 hypothetical protein DPMN_060721 [Dreissena polymorpha]